MCEGFPNDPWVLKHYNISLKPPLLYTAFVITLIILNWCEQMHNSKQLTYNDLFLVCDACMHIVYVKLMLRAETSWDANLPRNWNC